MNLGPDVTWTTLEPGSRVFREWWQRLLRALPSANSIPVYPRALRVAHLPCYSETALLEVTPAELLGPVYAFLGPAFLHFVEGGHRDLDAVNLRDEPELTTDASVQAYVRLWLELEGAEQGWRLVETRDALCWSEGATASDIHPVEALVRPLVLSPKDAFHRHRIDAVVQRPCALHQCTFIVWNDGLVQSRPDTLLASAPLLLPPPQLIGFSALDFGAGGLRGTVDLLEEAPVDEDSLYDALEASSTALGSLDLDSPPAPSAMDTDTQTNEDPAAAWTLGAVFERLADLLLSHALRTCFPASEGRDAASSLHAYLEEFRPTVLIETPYRELAGEFAQVLARGARLPLNTRWDTPLTSPSRLANHAEIVLLTEKTFRGAQESNDVDVGAFLAPIIRGPHIALMIVSSLEALPQEARDMIDLRIEVPRMDDRIFWECTGALFGQKVRRRRAEWVRYATPRDMARIAAATRDHRRYLAELEVTIQRRLAQYTAPDAPALEELHGLGEARFRMEELSSDIRAALAGKIGWHQVDRGYLLAGPPGTGKTTLVRALAKACGIRFVLASASRWQESTSLGPHIQAIRRTFHEARLYAPSILFIDEIDSLGSRNRTESHNSQYQTVVINTVLEELQGFESREGVIVIGATNNPENVDEALRRPGRLDRIVQVPYPTVAALASIYEYYLRRAERDGAQLTAIDTHRLGQLTFGRTGSHVELYVRGAVRRARRDGRSALLEADIVAEITSRPPEGFGTVLSAALMRRVAVHEAGHAIVSLTGLDHERDLPMISITPRSDGSLGFVARAPSDSALMTREDVEEAIRVMLGGRAAEELVFGRDEVTGGAGGSATSDLGQATRTVIRLLTEYGYSDANGLLWIDWNAKGVERQVTAEAVRNLPIGQDLLREARETVDRLYEETLARLAENRALLDRVAETLVEKQELSSQMVRAIVNEIRR